VINTLRTLLSLAYRAVTHPENRFLGEAGRRVLSFGVFVIVGLTVLSFASAGARLELAATTGWVAAAACYLGLTWTFVLAGTPELTRRWALAQDSPRSRALRRVFGRAVGFGVVVLATAVGLLTGTGLLQGGGALLRALSAVAVIEAWLVLQISYGLYYAYLYYQADKRGTQEDGSGVLEFPGDEEPGLVDFCYFAFAIGTAFAVSDVRVTSSGVRKVVIGHSLLSFVYNAAILTLALSAVPYATLG